MRNNELYKAFDACDLIDEDIKCFPDYKENYIGLLKEALSKIPAEYLDANNESYSEEIAIRIEEIVENNLS